MLKLIDLTYYFEPKFKSLNELSMRYRSTLGYADYIKDRIDISVIKHLSKEESTTLNGVKYFSFITKNVYAFIPLRTHTFIKSLNPDVVLIQGLVFPLKVIFLRRLLGRKPVFILQYHGGKPCKMPRLILQRLADRFVDAYLFTGKEMADEWIKKGVIANKDKCYELPEGSTYLTRQNKADSKIKLGFQGNNNFLWVGRLNKNKDPITILSGFEKYLHVNNGAKLYMIYQTNDLLPEIEQKINESELLKNAVNLIGKIEHEQLAYWYSAADFYLSGSHHEGSGFALFESMACGCIPVVSHIAPFRKMLSDGKFGFLFETGNADDLFATLKELENINREELSMAVSNHFQETMSFKAIADQLMNIIHKLVK